MRRLVLLAGLIPLLAGCFYLPPIVTGSSSGRETPDAQANLRAAVPAIEAWNADYGTYAGITLEALRRAYDPSIADAVHVVRATKDGYCIESTASGETWSYRGPAPGFERGGC